MNESMYAPKGGGGGGNNPPKRGGTGTGGGAGRGEGTPPDVGGIGGASGGSTPDESGYTTTVGAPVGRGGSETGGRGRGQGRGEGRRGRGEGRGRRGPGDRGGTGRGGSGRGGHENYPRPVTPPDAPTAPAAPTGPAVPTAPTVSTGSTVPAAPTVPTVSTGPTVPPVPAAPAAPAARPVLLGRIFNGIAREPLGVPEVLLAELRSSGRLQGATGYYNNFLRSTPNAGRYIHGRVDNNPMLRSILRLYQYEDGLIPLSTLNGEGPAPQAVYDAATAAGNTSPETTWVTSPAPMGITPPPTVPGRLQAEPNEPQSPLQTTATSQPQTNDNEVPRIAVQQPSTGTDNDVSMGDSDPTPTLSPTQQDVKNPGRNSPEFIPETPVAALSSQSAGTAAQLETRPGESDSDYRLRRLLTGYSPQHHARGNEDSPQPETPTPAAHGAYERERVLSEAEYKTIEDAREGMRYGQSLLPVAPILWEYHGEEDWIEYPTWYLPEAVQRRILEHVRAKVAARPIKPLNRKGTSFSGAAGRRPTSRNGDDESRPWTSGGLDMSKTPNPFGPGGIFAQGPSQPAAPPGAAVAAGGESPFSETPFTFTGEPSTKKSMVSTPAISLFRNIRTGICTTEHPSVGNGETERVSLEGLINTFNTLRVASDEKEKLIEEMREDLDGFWRAYRHDKDAKSLFLNKETGRYIIDDGSNNLTDLKFENSDIKTLIEDYDTSETDLMAAEEEVKKLKRVVAADPETMILEFYDSEAAVPKGFITLSVDALVKGNNAMNKQIGEEEGKDIKMLRVGVWPDGTHTIVTPDQLDDLPEGLTLCEWPDLIGELNKAKSDDMEGVEGAPSCTIPEHNTLQTERDRAVLTVAGSQEDFEQQTNKIKDLEATVLNLNTIVTNLNHNNQQGTIAFNNIDGQRLLAVAGIEKLTLDLEAMRVLGATEEVRRLNAEGEVANLHSQLASAQTAVTTADTARQNAENQVAELTTATTNGKTDLTTAQTALETTQADLVTAQTDSRTTRDELATAKTELVPATKALSTAEAALKSTEDELKTAKADLETAKAELATAQAVLKAAQDELEAAKANLKTAKAELATSQADLKSAEDNLAAAKAELATANADLATKVKELKAVKKELKTASTDLATSRADLKTAEDGLATAKTDLETKEKELKTANSESATSQADAKTAQDGLKDAGTAKDAASPQQTAVEDVKQAKKKLGDELKKLKDELEKCQKQHMPKPVGCYIPEHSRLEGKIKRLEKEIKSLGDDIMRLEKEVTRLEQELAKSEKEKTALKKKLDEHVAAAKPGSDACNVKEHKDLKDEKELLQEQYDAIKELCDDLKKTNEELENGTVPADREMKEKDAAEEPRETFNVPAHRKFEEEKDADGKCESCTVKAHRTLEEAKKKLQDEYDSLYDYTYLLQQDGWDLLNHLAVKPVG